MLHVSHLVHSLARHHSTELSGTAATRDTTQRAVDTATVAAPTVRLDAHRP